VPTDLVLLIEIPRYIAKECYLYCCRHNNSVGNLISERIIDYFLVIGISARLQKWVVLLKWSLFLSVAFVIVMISDYLEDEWLFRR
jgi:hypothetical protein